MPEDVLALLAAQCGVVGRHQLAGLGISDNVLQRWVRTRLLVRLMRGAYVAHTGEPTFDQWCWAAVWLIDPPPWPVRQRCEQPRVPPPAAGRPLSA